MARKRKKKDDGLWDMIKSVFIVAIKYNQFYAALAAGLIALFIIVFPKDRLAWLTIEVYGSLKNGSLNMALLMTGSWIGWLAHVRKVRRAYDLEIMRITEERDRLNEIVLAFNHSQKPKHL